MDELVPAGHLTEVEGLVQYEPAAQGVAAEDPAGQYSPKAHSSLFAPPLHLFPAGHWSHAAPSEICPSSDPNFPAAHSVQIMADPTDQLPTAHGVLVAGLEQA